MTEFSAQQRHVIPMVDATREAIRIGARATKLSFLFKRNQFGGPSREDKAEIIARPEPLNWWPVKRHKDEKTTAALQLPVDHARSHRAYDDNAAEDVENIRENLSVPVVEVDGAGRPLLRSDVRDVFRVRYSSAIGDPRVMLNLAGGLQFYDAARQGRDATTVAGAPPKFRADGGFLWLTSTEIGGEPVVGAASATFVGNPIDQISETKGGRPICPPALNGAVHFEDGIVHGPIERNAPFMPKNPEKDWEWYRGQIYWASPGPRPASNQLSVAVKLPPQQTPPPWTPPIPPEPLPPLPPLPPPTGRPETGERDERIPYPGGDDSRPETSDRRDNPEDGPESPPGDEPGGYKDPESGIPTGDEPPHPPRIPTDPAGPKPKRPQERNMRGPAEIEIAPEPAVGQVAGNVPIYASIAPTYQSGRLPVGEVDELAPEQVGIGEPCCMHEDRPIADPIVGGPLPMNPEEEPDCPEADALRRRRERVQKERDEQAERVERLISEALDRILQERGFDDLDDAVQRKEAAEAQQKEHQDAANASHQVYVELTIRRDSGERLTPDERRERLRARDESNLEQIRADRVGKDVAGYERILERSKKRAERFGASSAKAKLRILDKQLAKIDQKIQKALEDCRREKIKDLDGEDEVAVAGGKATKKKLLGPICAQDVGWHPDGVYQEQVEFPRAYVDEDGNAWELDSTGQRTGQQVERLRSFPEAPGGVLPIGERARRALLEAHDRLKNPELAQRFIDGEALAPNEAVLARADIGRALTVRRPYIRSQEEQLRWLTDKVRGIYRQVDAAFGGRHADFLASNFAIVQTNGGNIAPLPSYLGQVVRNESVDEPAIKLLAHVVTDRNSVEDATAEGAAFHISAKAIGRGHKVTDDRTLLLVEGKELGDAERTGRLAKIGSTEVEADGLLSLVEVSATPDAARAGRLKVYTEAGSVKTIDEDGTITTLGASSTTPTGPWGHGTTDKTLTGNEAWSNGVHYYHDLDLAGHEISPSASEYGVLVIYVSGTLKSSASGGKIHADGKGQAGGTGGTGGVGGGGVATAGTAPATDTGNRVRSASGGGGGGGGGNDTSTGQGGAGSAGGDRNSKQLDGAGAGTAGTGGGVSPATVGGAGGAASNLGAECAWVQYLLPQGGGDELVGFGAGGGGGGGGGRPKAAGSSGGDGGDGGAGGGIVIVYARRIEWADLTLTANGEAGEDGSDGGSAGLGTGGGGGGGSGGGGGTVKVIVGEMDDTPAGGTIGSSVELSTNGVVLTASAGAAGAAGLAGGGGSADGGAAGNGEAGKAVLHVWGST